MRGLVVGLAVAMLVTATSTLAGHSAANEINLRSLEVPASLQAGVPYEARLPYTKTGSPRVTKACFLWSGEGPYCFSARVSESTIRARLRTNNPNRYRLEGFVEYRAGGQIKHSNRVTATIRVR